MKKSFILLAVLVVLTIPGAALASDITDALYYGVITVSNNGTSAERVSTIMSLDSQSLIDVYDIDTAFDYVAIRNSTGTDVPFAPSVNATYPWSLWVPSIVDDGNMNYLFYMGQSSLNATKYYFPGPTGMVINDAPGLECSSNFSIEIDGYINTDDIFPTIESTSNSTKDTLGTSHSVTLPDDITVGDLLLLTFGAYAGAATNPAITWPAGWSNLDKQSQNYYGAGVCYRIADGTEGTSVTVTTAVNAYSAHQIYRIQNYEGVPEISPSATATDANPNSANLAPSWGYGDSTLFLSFFGGGIAAVRTISSYPANYSAGGIGVSSAGYAYNGIGVRELTAASDNPGSFTLSGIVAWYAWTIGVKGRDSIIFNKASSTYCYLDAGGNIIAAITGGASVTASGITAGEHKVEVYADSTNLTIEIDDVIEDTEALGGVPVPNNANNWYIGSYATPYIEYAKIYVGGTLQGSWEWEYDTTFTDLSGNNHAATPSFRMESSDADVSASLVSFQPIDTAIPPPFSVEDAAPFITGNVTMTGQFTTGNVSTTGGPPGFALVSELASQGNTPNIWAFGIIALCMVSAGQLFWVWMQRRYGFRSMWPMFATGLFIMGIFVALGGAVKVFDFWMIVFYIVIFICLMVMSRHTEVGGNVSTHGMIGFAAQSWIGLTLINKMLEGTFIGASETAWVNTYAFTQEFKLFNIFSLPVLNLDFWTKGIPSLLRWDYSFFGGNAQLFQYLLYALTAVVSFIIFSLLIGLLYNFFRGR